MLTPASNLSLSDVRAIGILLRSEVEHHKKLNTLFLRWFNELVPEGADPLDCLEYSPTQVFLQDMTTYHASAAVNAERRLLDFEGVVNTGYAG